ncbi:MAG: hypothetical protein J5854_05550 [Clostridia bacterium]|nr:hypothetical protein [Clostridia bacterium]
MKRFLSVFAALILVVMTAASPALASSQPKFYLEGPSAANVGDAVEISLKLEGTYEASIINVKVRFDPAAFSFVSVTKGEAANNMDTNPTIEGVQDHVSFGAIFLTDPTTETGTLMTIKLSVRSADVPNQKITVDVDEFKLLPLTATVAEDVPFTKADLSIKLSGSSGAAATATPAPAVTDTPAPAVTDTPAPNVTDTPAPDVTEIPEETEAPGTTEDVSPTETAPAAIETAAPTEAGGDTPNVPENKLKDYRFWWYVAGGVAVFAAAVILVLVLRKKKK